MIYRILILILITSSVCFGQFREELERPKDIRGGITNDAPPSLMLGFFNPENFTMNHSFNLSYTAFGGHGVSLGVYTNSMFYKINEDLDIQVDASLVTSPYNTFGNSFSDQISGFYLSRAQLNYRPTENSSISIQFRQLPYGYGNPYGYSNYRNSYFGSSFWGY